jgi:metallo-beta-lactamase class B
MITMKYRLPIFAALVTTACLFSAPVCVSAADQSVRSATRTMRHWSPSEELDVNEVAAGVFVVNHKTPISSNSLVVFGRDGSCLFVDTPWTPEATETLVEWVVNTMGGMPESIAVNTHFHLDRLGGNACLIKHGVPVYGSDLTIALIKEKGDAYIKGGKDVPVVPPDHVFSAAKGCNLTFDDEPVEIWYPGPGHTRDNVVVYLPKRGVLFGGCLVKCMAAKDKGNIVDADLTQWAASLKALKKQFPDAKVVVPGHGAPGGMELIDHTIELVK